MDLVKGLLGIKTLSEKPEIRTNDFFGGCAMVPGFDHLRMRKNCQDKAGYGEIECLGQIFRFGMSIDGCGSGEDSEFGAILAKQFVDYKIRQLISIGTPLLGIPREIFESLSMEMWRILPFFRKTDQIIKFILDSLLFTLFVFIQGPQETVVFFLGDGIICLNAKILVGKEKKTASGNAPDYPAYALIPEIDRNYIKIHSVGKTVYVPKKEFEVMSFMTAEVDQLLIGSDAWHDETFLVEEITRQLPDWQPGNVQTQMNIWSGVPYRTPTKQLHFADDASIAFIQRVVNSEEENNENCNP
jgi:hypothetical protein